MALPLFSRGRIIRCAYHRSWTDYRFYDVPSRRRAFSSPGVNFPPSTAVFIFSTVYPEPDASATGVRTSFLMEQLAKTPGISAIHYVSAKNRSKTRKRVGQEKAFQRLEKEFGVQFHVVPPNKSNLTRNFLKATVPDSNHMMVIFDRFYAEEMYSFHIHKSYPHAVKVLDMQDMHSLRWARQKTVEESRSVGLKNLPIQVRAGIHDPRLLRELASIHRMDLTLVCSQVEIDILQDTYQIPGEKLCVAPLFGYQDKGSPRPSFPERSDFVFVGGFRHDPNIDAVFQLKHLWPRIRKGLDDTACLHIYGAFGSHHKPKECHDPANGMLVHGYESSLDVILSTKRVMLAPLHFGAGIKGKIVDAWKYGIPVVTTPIGSEGMGWNHSGFWPGRVVHNDDQFVRAAIDLYQNVCQWNQATSTIPEFLPGLCGPLSWNAVALALCRSVEKVEERREKDFVQSVLWRESLRSTEYFSRYIESKNMDKEN